MNELFHLVLFLCQLFSDQFDTTIGAKVEKESYERIAKAIDLSPERILFLTDIPKGRIIIGLVFHAFFQGNNTYVIINIKQRNNIGRQSLRFASRDDFVVPHARTFFKQHRDFSIVGPSAWNSLPSEFHSLPRDLCRSFYKLLKTFIYARAWDESASE